MTQSVETNNEASGGAASQDATRREDAKSVRQASSGDLAAFERLIDKYRGAVFNIALYKSKNYFDAEDLTQEIFMAAFEALPTLKRPEIFSSWLFGIAYNRCHKWYRRQRTKVIKIEELRQQARREQSVAHREAVRGTNAEPALSDYLRRLPEDVVEVLKFRYLEGLSYKEIEKKVGLNSHRIDYLIRKGKQLLRERVAREENA